MPLLFPAVLCVAVNDAVVQGIPGEGEYELRNGDLVSLDCGAVLDGWVGDAAVSFTVGRARPKDLRLSGTAKEALDARIAAAVVGNRIGDIAHAVGRGCRSARYGIPDGLDGHGVGRTMHEEPGVPNEAAARQGDPCVTAWPWRSRRR